MLRIVMPASSLQTFPPPTPPPPRSRRRLTTRMRLPTRRGPSTISAMDSSHSANRAGRSSGPRLTKTTRISGLVAGIVAVVAATADAAVVSSDDEMEDLHGVLSIDYTVSDWNNSLYSLTTTFDRKGTHISNYAVWRFMEYGKEADSVQRQIIRRTQSIKKTDNGIGRHFVVCNPIL